MNRLLLVVAASLACAVAMPKTAAAALTTYQALGVKAKQVTYWSNRFIVTADGEVAVNLGDGARLTGDTFAMDLRLNRFVLAGNVKLFVNGAEYDGVAFADYIDFDRQYFIPIGEQPDRWTFANSDYSKPILGRQMPGDTFYLPDLSGERAFVHARHAVIQPRESVKFTPAEVNFGLAFIPFPSYFLNFSANPNFSQNALAGAYVDGPLDMFGGGHSLATVHLRYDQQNKVYFSLEEHQVSERHYLVASVNPLTRPLKQYNFLGSDLVSPNIQVQGQFQESAFQVGGPFKQPLSATGFAQLKLTGAFPRSYIDVNFNQYYMSFLAQPKPGVAGLLYYGDPTHNWVPDHPLQATATWNSYQNRIFHSPFFLRTRVGMGMAHGNPGPAQFFGNTAYPSVYDHLVGFNVSLPSLRLIRDQTGYGRDVYFNASFDKQRDWFSVPHHVDTTVTTFSLNRQFDRHLNLLLSYTIQNLNDYYGAHQTDIYPQQIYFSTQTGDAYPSWAAFRGQATTRSLVAGLLYTPSTAFTSVVTLRKNHDWPEPVPGMAPIYQQLTFQNNGVTPYEAKFEVRFRVNRLLTLNVSRSYFFNFGGYERWTPFFGVQVVK
ncbi:MAG: hypothetical protein GIW95_06525 [Candidatus Eremiobacteraeota bacterium]|nr:hypothetical protein [Candidatus Eremiobacteraeota bacterium]